MSGIPRLIHIPRHLCAFFLYLRVVRGHSVYYALTLLGRVGGGSKVRRCAQRHFRDFASGWWIFPEEDEKFDLWSAVGVTA